MNLPSSSRWIALAAALFGSDAFAQSTLEVPAGFPAIQSAIAAAVDGDTIVVAPGTYDEHLDFLGKRITVRSAEGAALTIIDVAGGGNVATFHHGETRESVLEGFTIRHARVSLLSASPTIRNNIFEDNALPGGGSGAAINGSFSSPLIVGNLFRRNRCDSQYNAGVVSIYGDSSPQILNNVFADNQCRGLAVFQQHALPLHAANNTFVRNRQGLEVRAATGAAGQIYENNVFYGNGVGVEVVDGNDGRHPLLRGNLVFGNGTDYVGMPPAARPGNLSADPLLGGLLVGDYHPDAGSPLIDAGRDRALLPGETDFYGRTRALDGDGNGAPRMDIGAAEHVTTTPRVTLDLDPTVVAIGETALLEWTAVDADSCVAQGAWSGHRPLSGNLAVSGTTAGRLDYVLACEGPGGTRGALQSLEVMPPPVITISVEPEIIALGDSALVSWTGDARACTAAGAWDGPLASSGTLQVTPSSAGTHAFTIVCEGFGETTASTTLRVEPTPRVTVTASPAVIDLGQVVTIQWSSANVTQCAAEVHWIGRLRRQGQTTRVPEYPGLRIYRVTCKWAGGTVTSTANVMVRMPPQAWLEVSASSIVAGQSVRLSWGSVYADACHAGGAWSGPRRDSGSAAVVLRSPGRYGFTLTCTGYFGSVTVARRVVVVAGDAP